MATRLLTGFDANNQRGRALADPSAATDAATKQYVDNVANGLRWKAPVRVATTGPGALATDFENADTVDGIALVTGDRILIKNQAAGAENGIYCLDTETEILTQRGFKRHDSLIEGELVLTLNMGSGLAEWQPALSVHTFPVEDIEVLSMESRGHSSLSTLNHRWPVRRNVDHGKSGLQRHIVIRESHELAPADSLIRSAACSTLPTVAKYDDALVELVAWFITEGHLRVNNSGTASTGVRIGQSAAVNPEYVDRIRACLTALWGAPTAVMRRPRGGNRAPEWRERPGQHHGMTVFDLNTVAGRALVEVAPNRVVDGSFIADLTLAQLRMFLDTCIDADGCRSNGQTIFSQKSSDRLAPIQMAATLLGIATSVHVGSDGAQQIITLNKGSTSQPHQTPGAQRVRFTGTVWCPRTENSTWLARRNGSVYFTGNTVNATGAPTRAADADTGTELQSATVFIAQGTVNADKAYTQTADSVALGTTAITFIQFGGGTTYTTDGQGIGLSGTTFSLELDGTSLSKSATGLRLGAAAAAAGLVADATGLLSVGQGAGIAVTADAVAVDLAVVVRKFSVSIGDGTATTFTVTHNLGTRDVTVEIYEAAAPYTSVLADVTHDTTNTIVVAFFIAPTASQYRVVVHG